jgi:energy-coupling factor transporter transmembrane protein EcfT
LKIKINNNVYIKGSFIGKYQAESSSSSISGINLSKINIVEANIENAVKSSYSESVGANSISLHLSNLNDVKIIPKKSIENHQFIEDLNDVVIYNIQFSEIIKEGDRTFGTISGNIYGALFNQDEIEFVKIKKSKPEFIISKPKPKYIIIKDKIKSNFFPYLTYVFYALLLICFASVFGPLATFITALVAGFLYFFSKYIVKVFHYIFKYSYLFFFLLIFYGLGSLFFTNSIKENKIYNEDNIYEKRLNSGENFLMAYDINWKDNSKRKYFATLSVYSEEYLKSKDFKENLQLDLRLTNIPIIYSDISKRDYKKLSNIYSALREIKSSNPSLSRKEFADVMVTMVQNIPYGLQIQGDCKVSYENNDMVKKMVKAGFTCESNIKFGIYSPLEFIGNFKGDCDTRTVFLYTLFKKFNYDAVILNSLQYQHSILGINLPSYGKFKKHNGKKYYVWETTAPGFEIGVIPKKISDISKWHVVI